MIYLRLLGALDAQAQDGRDLAVLLRQPKALALLAYLTLGAHGFLRRDTLVAMFWPESDQVRGRASLRKMLHKLRLAVGPDGLQNRGIEEVAIDSSVVQCDVRDFEAAAMAGDWERAGSLYGGDVLDGFFISGAPEFERWLDQERMRLRTLACDAAWGIAEVRRREGKLREAGRWADRAAAREPHDELAMQRVVRFFADMGDRSGAISRYEQYVDFLATEFETGPSAAMEALGTSLRTTPDATRGLPQWTPDPDADTHVPGSASRHASRRGVAFALAALSLVVSSGDARRFEAEEPETWPVRLAVRFERPADGELRGDSVVSMLEREVLAALREQPGIELRRRRRGSDAASGGFDLEIGMQVRGDTLDVTARLLEDGNTERWRRNLRESVAAGPDASAPAAAALARTVLGEIGIPWRPLARRRTAAGVTADYHLAVAGAIWRQAHNGTGSMDRAVAQAVLDEAETALRIDPSRAEGYNLAFRAHMTLSGFLADTLIRLAETAVAQAPANPVTYNVLQTANRLRGRAHASTAAGLRAMRQFLAENQPINVDQVTAIKGTLVGLDRAYVAIGKFDSALVFKEILAQRFAPETQYVFATMSWLLGDLPIAREWWANTADTVFPDVAFVEVHEGHVVEAARMIDVGVRRLMDTRASSIRSTNLVSLADAANAIDLPGRALEILGLAEHLEELLPFAAELCGNWWRTTLGYALAETGERGEGRAVLDGTRRWADSLIADGVDWYLPRYALARVYAYLGDREASYRALQAAIDAGWRCYYRGGMGVTDPMLRSLRGEPRFASMMDGVKASVDSMLSLVELAELRAAKR